MVEQRVRIHRAGAVLVLSAEGVDQRWSVKKWKAREMRGFEPWWYEAGQDWLLYDGPVPGDGPPVRSFESLALLRDHVESLVPDAGSPG